MYDGLDIDHWRGSKTSLSECVIDDTGWIEDLDSHLMIDFANKYIGGGVMNQGMVQEEIYFLIYPECLISSMCCERMENWETIFITGAKRFSKYTGYADKTKFAGFFNDPLDDGSNVLIPWTFAAIDAIHYPHWGTKEQFEYEKVLRELRKAYIGF